MIRWTKEAAAGMRKKQEESCAIQKRQATADEQTATAKDKCAAALKRQSQFPQLVPFVSSEFLGRKGVGGETQA
jgi:hypothetical protein